LSSRVLGAAGRPGANHRLTIAHIGVGGMGMAHVQNILRFEKEGKVRIAAVCDTDETGLKLPSTIVTRASRHIATTATSSSARTLTPSSSPRRIIGMRCRRFTPVKPVNTSMSRSRRRHGARRPGAGGRRRAANVSVQVGAQARTALGAWQTCRAIRNGIVGKVKKVTCWHYASPADEQRCRTANHPSGWTGICGSARCLGGLTTNVTARHVPLAHGVRRRQIRDRGAHQSAPFSGV